MVILIRAIVPRLDYPVAFRSGLSARVPKFQKLKTTG